jgi:hypothetical protein
MGNSTVPSSTYVAASRHGGVGRPALVISAHGVMSKYRSYVVLISADGGFRRLGPTS